MDKLDMQSKNLVDDNIEKIAKLFPNCITEGRNEDGQVVKLVDFDLLKQELSKDIVEGNDERYTLNWAGKKQAILTANSPINATLRPCREESVGKDGKPGEFDSQNLYIEGDNLDVLKLLRETYLGKVKMIYIDPPYNTGNDFVYEDDFATSAEDYLQASKSYDEQGNRMFQNNESNGRFHSDWLSMMYSRLKLSKDLLTDDGLLCVSIDDNEYKNLIKIFDEVFGEQNYETTIKWRRRSNQPNDATKMVATVSEYIVIYSKTAERLKETKNFGTVELSPERLSSYTNPDNDPRGEWSTTPWCASKGQGGTKYKIVTPKGVVYDEVWLGTEDTFNKYLKEGRIYWTSDGNGKPRKKVYKTEAISRGQAAIDFWVGEKFGDNLTATSEMKQLFQLDRVFDYTKPVKLIKTLIKICAPTKDAIVIDFFSGSATTAHAVMQLNAEDGGNRKFIMVQLPELCDEKSEAYKAGYKNICEIGKERIRRAGKKIKELNSMDGDILLHRLLNKDKITEKDREDFKKTKEYEEFCNNLDTGFRVLKLDSSCMKDVYYSPAEMSQDLLARLEDNIKEDRTAEDLLFQVMLDMGVVLSSEIKTIIINGKKVFNVNNGNLVCCFEKDINEAIVTEIAKMEPLYAVFRDASMSTDSVAVNFDQIFETYSPTTTRKVL